MTPFVISLLVFFAVMSTVATVGMAIRDLREPGPDAAGQPQRLRRLTPDTQGAGESGVAAFDRWFGRLVGDLEPSWNPAAAALVMILFGAVCGTAIFVWDERLVPAVTAGLVAAPLPVIYLVFRRARRLAKLQDQLPAALEILSRSLRAGQTLDQAIRLLSEHLPQPLGSEFRWCSRQLEMGLALPAVMRSMVQRVPLYDVRIFATTLIVHRQTGGNVVSVLDRLAQVIRERLNSRRQLRATTAAGRMSAGMVSLVGPAVFIYFFFFRTEYVNPMLQSPLGQMLLVIALALEVVGLLWTLRLLKPAY